WLIISRPLNVAIAPKSNGARNQTKTDELWYEQNPCWAAPPVVYYYMQERLSEKQDCLQNVYHPKFQLRIDNTDGIDPQNPAQNWSRPYLVPESVNVHTIHQDAGPISI